MNSAPLLNPIFLHSTTWNGNLYLMAGPHDLSSAERCSGRPYPSMSELSPSHLLPRPIVSPCCCALAPMLPPLPGRLPQFSIETWHRRYEIFVLVFATRRTSDLSRHASSPHSHTWDSPARGRRQTHSLQKELQVRADNGTSNGPSPAQ